MPEDHLRGQEEDEDRDDVWWRAPEGHTQAKINAVSNYFPSWARIVAPSSPVMRYIDCYAGRGKFADGTNSVPLHILTFASENKECQQKLQSFLNDSNQKTATILKSNIDAIPGISNLQHRPEISNKTIDSGFADRLKTVGELESSYVFVDPYGGKGVSVEMLHGLFKHAKTDGFVFFNYNRNNMWLHNPNVEHLMRGLFGDLRFAHLRDQVEVLPDDEPPETREQMIITMFQDALREEISAESVPLKLVKQDNGKIYYLLGLSKHAKGFTILKDVLANESTARPQGVPLFEWNPKEHQSKPLLYQSMMYLLDELEAVLPHELAGRKLTPKQMVWAHGKRNRYLVRNYQEACDNLWRAKKVDVPEPGKSGKLTQDTVVIFPAVPR